MDEVASHLLTTFTSSALSTLGMWRLSGPHAFLVPQGNILAVNVYGRPPPGRMSNVPPFNIWSRLHPSEQHHFAPDNGTPLHANGQQCEHTARPSVNRRANRGRLPRRVRESSISSVEAERLKCRRIARQRCCFLTSQPTSSALANKSQLNEARQSPDRTHITGRQAFSVKRRHHRNHVKASD